MLATQQAPVERMIPVTNFEERLEIEAFVLRECRLLDLQLYEEWAELFALDGHYWVPATRDQLSPHNTVSLFYDDKQTIEGRIARLRHPNIHTQTPPSRICHVVTDVNAVKDVEQNLLCAYSSFHILEYRPGSDQRLYGGRFEHTIRRRKNGFEIVMKRVNLLNCDAPLPALAVPF